MYLRVLHSPQSTNHPSTYIHIRHCYRETFDLFLVTSYSDIPPGINGSDSVPLFTVDIIVVI